MKGLLAMLTAFALMAGCEQVEEKRPIVWRAPPLVSAGATAMAEQLSAARIGESPVNGKLLEDKVVQQGRVPMQRYVVQSRNGAMLLEADVYALLLKKGYVRRVVKEAADVFAVDYVKQGDVTISAQYRPIKEAAPAESQAQSQAVFSWKISG